MSLSCEAAEMERAKLHSVGLYSASFQEACIDYPRCSFYGQFFILKKKETSVVASVQTVARCDRLAKGGRLVRVDSTR